MQAPFPWLQLSGVKGSESYPCPISPGDKAITLFKDPGMLTAPFSFSVLCCQEPASLSRGVKREICQPDPWRLHRREIQEEVGENWVVILLYLVEKCTSVAWKRWACNCLKRWLPSAAGSGALSCWLWNGCFVHLGILQQSFLSGLTLTQPLKQLVLAGAGWHGMLSCSGIPKQSFLCLFAYFIWAYICFMFNW